MCAGTSTQVYMWRSKDNLQELVLPFPPYWRRSLVSACVPCTLGWPRRFRAVLLSLSPILLQECWVYRCASPHPLCTWVPGIAFRTGFCGKGLYPSPQVSLYVLPQQNPTPLHLDSRVEMNYDRTVLASSKKQSLAPIPSICRSTHSFYFCFNFKTMKQHGLWREIFMFGKCKF